MNPVPEINPANPNPSPKEGRDACGRFARGNPGGPGNPFPRRVAALRHMMLTCVTDEDMAAITRAVIEEAKAGNIAAAKLIFQYVLGKHGPAAEWIGDEGSGMHAQGLAPLADEIVRASSPPPKANGSNGTVEPSRAAAAPIVNGSNGASPASFGITLPTGSGREIDHWLDRQVRRTMEALGKAPSGIRD